MSLINIYKGRIFKQIFKKKKKPENEKREEALLLNTEKAVETGTQEKREEQPRPGIRTRYTDEECTAMIKNRCVPFDAPRWVRYEIERIRLKKLAEAKSPEEEMREWMRSKGASNVGS
jgi:hypothetical protein